jgi:hypothetical protein
MRNNSCGADAPNNNQAIGAIVEPHSRTSPLRYNALCVRIPEQTDLLLVDGGAIVPLEVYKDIEK